MRARMSSYFVLHFGEEEAVADQERTSVMQV